MDFVLRNVLPKLALLGPENISLLPAALSCLIGDALGVRVLPDRAEDGRI
jgi:hypothetical protein